MNPIIEMEDGQYIFTTLKDSDSCENYLNLINQLTPRGHTKNKNIQQFKMFINSIPDNHKIYILKKISTNEIIASATLILEPKIIYEYGTAGHIEDVIVAHSYKHKKAGTFLINYIIEICKQHKCYKVVLNTAEAIAPRFGNCGLVVNHNVQMEKRF